MSKNSNARKNTYSCTGLQLSVAKELTSIVSNTGEADACVLSDKRHGEGQSAANSLFRQFLLQMIAKYKDDARKGIEHFESDPERKKVMIVVPDLQ